MSNPPHTLTELKTLYSKCSACDLHKTRTHIVFGSGNIQSSVLLIGEAPGKEEDHHQKPFIGRSGILLRRLLKDAGIDPEHDLYISNLIKCRPPHNRPPKSVEITACKTILHHQLRLLSPDIIILVGAASCRFFLGKKVSITQLRGSWFPYDIETKTSLTIPIFHPAYLLRNPSKDHGRPLWLTQQDLKKISKKIATLPT